MVILTAGYILWTIQRVYLGPEYKGPHGDHLAKITPRELSIAVPLLSLAILFGVYPQAIFNYMTPSVDRSVDQLADWTREVKDHGGTAPPPAAAAAIMPDAIVRQKVASKMHEIEQAIERHRLVSDDLSRKMHAELERDAEPPH